MQMCTCNIMLSVLLFGAHARGVSVQLQLTHATLLLDNDRQRLSSHQQRGRVQSVGVAVEPQLTAAPLVLEFVVISKRNKDLSPRCSGEDTTQ